MVSVFGEREVADFTDFVGEAFEEFGLDAVLDGEIGVGASFAGAGESDVEDAVEVVDEGEVAAVGLKHGAEFVEGFLYGVSHRTS